MAADDAIDKKSVNERRNVRVTCLLNIEKSCKTHFESRKSLNINIGVNFHWHYAFLEIAITLNRTYARKNHRSAFLALLKPLT